MFDFLPRRNKGAVAEGEFLAVDVETTGLKPKRDQLVSIGWVPVTNRVIDLSGAGYFVLAGASVGDSATVHGVTDDEITSKGVAPEIVLAEFEKALGSRALLAHFAQMETGFISELHRQVRGKPWKFRTDEVTDTFELERRHMERMATYPRGEDLRLARVRQRYGLPNYHNHNAMTDALACAEVYLAITS